MNLKIKHKLYNEKNQTKIINKNSNQYSIICSHL